jgi:flagellar biosynthesis protein FlhF
MARYAALLGVPFQACESLESLHLALHGDVWKGLVLIDTPGISPADVAELNGLANFFGRLPRVEKHLVLRADARTADMVQMVARFSAIGPSHLLFTGLDEVAGPGAMVETLIRCGIPAVFAGTGQQIPDDLEEVHAPGLAREICGGNRLAAAAA